MSILTEKQRDAIIRTVYGEARGEPENGMIAVANVIRNRSIDPRWPDDPEAVVKQKLQFSTWNANDPNSAKIRALPTNNKFYQAIGHIVDKVWTGTEFDPTNGAVYYYAPRGMAGGKAPKWWGAALEESDGKSIHIGNHFFAGRVKQAKRYTMTDVKVMEERINALSDMACNVDEIKKVAEEKSLKADAGIKEVVTETVKPVTTAPKSNKRTSRKK